LLLRLTIQLGIPSTIKDVNDDGIPDIITVLYNNVSVLPGKGDGTFAAPKITLWQTSQNL
jgi:hypothetical protein